MTLSFDTTTPVLVTGATGYVAGRIVERLLQEGLTVHATVRDPSKTERLGYLHALADKHPGSIVFFRGNLNEPGSFAEGMKGCSHVFHVASPFASNVADPQKDLIDPAVNGTRTVLEQANATPSVQRVVVTSSCAAIYGDSVDLESTPDGVFTEAVWNTSSTLTHNPYALSKTLAEKEAWKIHDAQDQWKLVVMNPSLVMGPGVKIHGTSESFELMKQLGDGTFGTGAPDIRLGVVDVRDLADAHLAGAFLPDASGRNIISAHNTSFPNMAKALEGRFSAYPLPRRVLPKFLLWLIGPFVNEALTRSFISKNVGYDWKADHTKSTTELGITYRPLEETLGDFMQQLIDEGELPKK